jgi:hypothetical protein
MNRWSHTLYSGRMLSRSQQKGGRGRMLRLSELFSPRVSLTFCSFWRHQTPTTSRSLRWRSAPWGTCAHAPCAPGPKPRSRRGQSRSRRCTEALGIVRGLIFPRQFIERRLVASCPVAILRNVEFLVLVILYAGTVLIAPAVTFSIEAARFHKDRIPSNAPACYIVESVISN